MPPWRKKHAKIYIQYLSEAFCNWSVKLPIGEKVKEVKPLLNKNDVFLNDSQKESKSI